MGRFLFATAVEIIIRFLAILLGSLPTLIAAATALGLFKNAPIYPYDYYSKRETRFDDVSGPAEIRFDDVSGPDFRRAVQLRAYIYSATGVAIGVTCLVIVIQLLLIFLRLGISLRHGFWMKIFLLFDIVLSFVLAAGHNVAASFLTAHNTDYKWLVLEVEFVDIYAPDFIRYAMTVGSAFCSNATFFFFILAVFQLYLLFKDLSSKAANTATGNKSGTNNIIVDSTTM